MYNIYNDLYGFFSNRIATLRTQNGVSAREMSLALGQNPSYINRIENQKSLPSMEIFINICEYLAITPKEFFEDETENPKKIAEIVLELQRMDNIQLDLLFSLTKEFTTKNKMYKKESS